MADITKCANKNCKIKDMCYRYNARDSYYQSYANFNNDKVVKDKKECKEFWRINMKNKEIEELLNELKEVTNSKKLSSAYCITNKHWQLLLSYIEQLEEFKKEHLIMKQILIENGFWEKLLNDDRFLNYLREGDSDV